MDNNQNTNASSGFIKLNLTNNSFYVDKDLLNRLGYIGYKSKKLKTIFDFIKLVVQKDDRLIFRRTIDNLKENKEKAELNIHLVSTRKDIYTYSIELIRIENEIIGYLKLIVSDRDEGLYEKRTDIISLIQKLFDGLYEPAILLNESGEILSANKPSCLIFNDKIEKIIGRDVFDFIAGKDRKRVKIVINRIIKDSVGRIYSIEIGLLNTNVRRVEASLLGIPCQDQTCILMVMRDITKKWCRDNHIKSLLEEKSMILREMHHRVKNNFQFLLSMLKMQENYITSEDALRVIEGIKSRIKSMAYIHEQLYNIKYKPVLKSGTFISNLITNLYVEINSENEYKVITFLDDVEIHVDKLFYLALIINELVMNSILHSRPNSSHKCIISIELKKINNGEIEIIVSDNGRGLPPDIDIKNPKTLGLKLVSLFTRQLNGKLFIRVSEGTSISTQILH